MEDTNMTTYDTANATFNDAAKNFYAIQCKYRARQISDAQYVVALAIYKKAEAEYDAAFEIASKQEEYL